MKLIRLVFILSISLLLGQQVAARTGLQEKDVREMNAKFNSILCKGNPRCGKKSVRDHGRLVRRMMDVQDASERAKKKSKGSQFGILQSGPNTLGDLGKKGSSGELGEEGDRAAVGDEPVDPQFDMQMGDPNLSMDIRDNGGGFLNNMTGQRVPFTLEGTVENIKKAEMKYRRQAETSDLERDNQYFLDRVNTNLPQGRESELERQ